MMKCIRKILAGGAVLVMSKLQSEKLALVEV